MDTTGGISMDKVDLDDCYFALNKVLDFFNKPPGSGLLDQ